MRESPTKRLCLPESAANNALEPKDKKGGVLLPQDAFDGALGRTVSERAHDRLAGGGGAPITGGAAFAEPGWQRIVKTDSSWFNMDFSLQF